MALPTAERETMIAWSDRDGCGGARAPVPGGVRSV